MLFSGANRLFALRALLALGGTIVLSFGAHSLSGRGGGSSSRAVARSLALGTLPRSSAEPAASVIGKRALIRSTSSSQDVERTKPEVKAAPPRPGKSGGGGGGGGSSVTEKSRALPRPPPSVDPASKAKKSPAPVPIKPKRLVPKDLHIQKGPAAPIVEEESTRSDGEHSEGEVDLGTVLKIQELFTISKGAAYAQEENSGGIETWTDAFADRGESSTESSTLRSSTLRSSILRGESSGKPSTAHPYSSSTRDISVVEGEGSKDPLIPESVSMVTASEESHETSFDSTNEDLHKGSDVDPLGGALPTESASTTEEGDVPPVHSKEFIGLPPSPSSLKEDLDREVHDPTGSPVPLQDNEMDDASQDPLSVEGEQPVKTRQALSLLQRSVSAFPAKLISGTDYLRKEGFHKRQSFKNEASEGLVLEDEKEISSIPVDDIKVLPAPFFTVAALTLMSREQIQAIPSLILSSLQDDVLAILPCSVYCHLLPAQWKESFPAKLGRIPEECIREAFGSGGSQENHANILNKRQQGIVQNVLGKGGDITQRKEVSYDSVIKKENESLLQVASNGRVIQKSVFYTRRFMTLLNPSLLEKMNAPDLWKKIPAYSFSVLTAEQVRAIPISECKRLGHDQVASIPERTRRVFSGEQRAVLCKEKGDTRGLDDLFLPLRPTEELEGDQ